MRERERNTIFNDHSCARIRLNWVGDDDDDDDNPDPDCRGDLRSVATIWPNMEPEVIKKDRQLRKADPKPRCGDL